MPPESKPRIASAQPQRSPAKRTKSNLQSSRLTAPSAASGTLLAASTERRKTPASPLPVKRGRAKPAAVREGAARAAAANAALRLEGKPAPEPKLQVMLLRLLLPKRTIRM